MANTRNTFFLLFGIFSLLVSSINGTAQNPGQNKLTGSNNYDSLLKLKVDKKKSLPITLRAKNVPVSEIVKRLSQDFNISFGLSPTVSNYRPVLDLPPSSLETVLKSLAPSVVLEKEMMGGSEIHQIKKAYLFAHNENIPTLIDSNEGAKMEQVLIFEGNTEITEESQESAGLAVFVKFIDEKLTLRCQSQPVLFVFGRIAEELKIPLMVGRASNRTISANFENSRLDEAFVHFPKSVKLKYLLDLNTTNIKFTEISLEDD